MKTEAWWNDCGGRYDTSSPYCTIKPIFKKIYEIRDVRYIYISIEVDRLHKGRDRYEGTSLIIQYMRSTHSSAVEARV